MRFDSAVRLSGSSVSLPRALCNADAVLLILSLSLSLSAPPARTPSIMDQGRRRRSEPYARQQTSCAVRAAGWCYKYSEEHHCQGTRVSAAHSGNLGCTPTACFASSFFPSSSVGVLCYCRLSFLHLLGKVKSKKDRCGSVLGSVRKQDAWSLVPFLVLVALPCWPLGGLCELDCVEEYALGSFRCALDLGFK